MIFSFSFSLTIVRICIDLRLKVWAGKFSAQSRSRTHVRRSKFKKNTHTYLHFLYDIFRDLLLLPTFDRYFYQVFAFALPATSIFFFNINKVSRNKERLPWLLILLLNASFRYGVEKHNNSWLLAKLQSMLVQSVIN